MRIIWIIAVALAVGFATAFATLVGISGMVMLAAFMVDFEARGAAVGSVVLVPAGGIGLLSGLIVAAVMDDDR